MPKVKITEEIEQKVVKLRQAGKQWKEISKELSLAVATCVNAEVKAELRNYQAFQWYAGMSRRLIASLLSIGITSIEKLEQKLAIGGPEGLLVARKFGKLQLIELMKWLKKNPATTNP